MTDTCENFLIKANPSTIKEQSIDVLLKKVFIKIRKIVKKTPALESLFDKVVS